MKHSNEVNVMAKTMTEKDGFTLIELIVALAILAVLASIALATYHTIKEKVYVAIFTEELHSIELAINSYVIEKGALPDSLADLGQGPKIDPWGRPVVYVNIVKGGSPRKDWGVNNINTDYDLYSTGADGLSNQLLSDPTSADDVIRGANGYYLGLGADY